MTMPFTYSLRAYITTRALASLEIATWINLLLHALLHRLPQQQTKHPLLRPQQPIRLRWTQTPNNLTINSQLTILLTQSNQRNNLIIVPPTYQAHLNNLRYHYHILHPRKIQNLSFLMTSPRRVLNYPRGALSPRLPKP